MDNDIITAELARIEAEAADRSKALLDNQHTFLRMHALAELLKQNGAPLTLSPSVVYYSSIGIGCLIYANHAEDDPEAVLNAIQDTRLPYRIGAGFNDNVRKLVVENYEGVEIILPAALFPNLQAVA